MSGWVDPSVICLAVIPGAEAVGVLFWLDLLVVVVELAAVPQAAVTTASAASTATTDEFRLILKAVLNVSPLRLEPDRGHRCVG